MRLLVVLAALAVVACAAVDFDLSLANGQLVLVSGGAAGSQVAAVATAATIPVPAESTIVDLTWSAAAAATFYWDVRQVLLAQDDKVAYDNLAVSYSVGTSGSIPTTPTPFTANFTCVHPGVIAVVNTIVAFDTASGSNSTVTFFIVKSCAEPDVCTVCTATCPKDRTCDCSATPAGSLCSQANSTKPDFENSVESLAVTVWNLNGHDFVAPPAIESTDARFARFHAALTKANDVPTDVAVFLQVWSNDQRDQVVDGMASMPNVIRQARGGLGKSDSAMMVVSKYTILRQSYETFTVGNYGVLAVTIEITPFQYLQLFAVTLDSTLPVAGQEGQVQSLFATIVSETNSAATRYPLGKLNIVVVGGFDSTLPDGSISFQRMKDLLKSPRDLYAEVGTPGDERYAFSFSYKNVTADNDAHEVKIISAAAMDDTGSLSKTAPLVLKLDFTHSQLVDIIVPSVICGLVLIALVSCFVTSQICHRRIPAPEFVRVYVRQSAALMKKNWLTTVRNRRALVIQFLVPIVFMALLYLMQYARNTNLKQSDFIPERNTSDVYPLDDIPRCEGEGCYSIIYTPSNDPIVDGFIRFIADSANPPIDAGNITKMDSSAQVDAYLLAHPKMVKLVVYCEPVYGNTTQNGLLELKSFSYVVQYNSTVESKPREPSPDPSLELLMPVQRRLEQAVLNYRLQYATGKTGFLLNYDTLRFPHPELLSVDVIGDNGPSFFLGCLMFNFVIQMGHIVGEREMRLREAMAVVGLRDAVYWTTWILTNTFWNTVTVFLLIAAGAAFQFEFFLANDFGTYFFLFFLFGVAMVPFAIFVSLFLSKARTATTAGFAIYLIGIVALGASNFIYDGTGNVNVVNLLTCLPFMALAKGMSDLGETAKGDNPIGLRWYDRQYSSTYFPLTEIYNWLIIDFFIYLALVLVYDFLFGGTHGESRVRTWINACTRGKNATKRVRDSSATDSREEDVIAEENKVKAAAIAKSNGSSSNSASELGGIQLQGLEKVYFTYQFGVCRDASKDFRAVDGSWLHIDDKQLFCLLGHNGAGKSTTISMLTGLLSPTGGDACILGKSLAKEPDVIRAEMGVCPQYDILWSELTGGEHIELFCALKGVPSDKWNDETATRLEAVGMTEDRGVFARAYSGGQKRRLSVAIALAGDPRVVYLDEPTTGMDPVSRRQVWELLEREKRNRLIVLTTHSMEEADMLGDRIAIMKEGKVVTLGSALHLKNHYGSGYRLAVVGKSNNDVAGLKAFVERALPNARLDYAAASTMHYEVPFGSEKDVLPAFLREAETRGDELGIADVQVGMTSLEDVFLRVAGGHDDEAEAASDNEDGKSADGSKSNDVDVEKAGKGTKMKRLPSSREAWSESSATPASSSVAVSENQEEIVGHASSSDAPTSTTGSVRPRARASLASGAASSSVAGSSKKGSKSSSGSESKSSSPQGDLDFSQFRPSFSRWIQFRALAIKSATMQIRQYKTNLCQIVFPLILILIMFLFQYLITNTVTRNAGDLSQPNVNPPLIPPVWILTANFDASDDCPRASQPAVIDESAGGMRFIVDGTSPLAVGAYGYSAIDTAAIWASTASAGLLGNVTRDVSRLLAFKGNTNIDSNIGFISSVTCYSRPFVIPITFTMDPSKTAMEEELKKSYGVTTIPGAIIFRAVDIENGQLDFGVYYNETISQGHDVPIMTNLFTNAAFRVLAPGAADAGIFFNGTRDFPAPSRPNDFDFATQLGPFFYEFIMQLYLPVILGAMVYEKEFKLREIMRMMGLKTEVYWVVRYITYYLLYLVAILIMVGIAAALQIRFYTINDFGPVIILILVWGHCLVAKSFLFSAFFSNSKTAVVSGYVYIFAFGLLSAMLISVYYDSPVTKIETIYGLMVLPPFALFRALVALRDAVQNFGPGMTMHDLTWGSPMVDALVYISVQWAVLLLLAMYCEAVVPDGNGVKLSPIFFLKPSWWCPTKFQRKNTYDFDESESVNESPEVAKERQRAWSEAGARQDMIRILGLRKVYAPIGSAPPTVAVDNLSMSIAPKECYGMLGPNGAGKSSTMNLLCGFLPPTAGTARIADLDIITQMEVAHLILGVCPQDNLIWEELTSYEHMIFYGQLKGITDKVALRDEIERRLTQVELWKVRDKRAGRYSGGMKRRLCMAIALIGTPPVLLLDEPTTGLDPRARNNLWEVVRDAKKDSCIVLTTHSMEEAEALCERVGIFVAGKLRTIGTPAQLKSSFGEFFKLTVTVPVQNLASLHAKVMKLVPDATIFNEPVVGTRVYQLPRKTTRLSELFAAVSKWVPQEGILDWGIANVSLEEVFLHVAADDDHKKEAVRSIESGSASGSKSGMKSGAQSGMKSGGGSGVQSGAQSGAVSGAVSDAEFEANPDAEAGEEAEAEAEAAEEVEVENA